MTNSVETASIGSYEEYQKAYLPDDFAESNNKRLSDNPFSLGQFLVEESYEQVEGLFTQET